MIGRFLLDTNIIIALFAKDAAVVKAMKGADEVFVPSIVIGELRYGALKSTRTQENLNRLTVFSAQNVILPCDAVTASYYGQIKHNLRLKAHPIPENDIWIAAVAQQNALMLVSRDGHFQAVDDLSSITW